MTVTKVLFKNSFNIVKKLTPVEASLLGKDLFLKNASLSVVSKIKEISPVLNQILPLVKGEHKHLSFDIKLRDVIKGKCPSIYGWHCDGKSLKSWNQEHQDRYLLLVNDKNCLTEFLSTPAYLEIDSSLSVAQQMQSFQKQIKEQKIAKVKIEPWTLIEYGNDSFHTVTAPLENHRRLLIRVNESDHLQPRTNNLELEKENG